MRTGHIGFLLSLLIVLHSCTSGSRQDSNDGQAATVDTSNRRTVAIGSHDSSVYLKSTNQFDTILYTLPDKNYRIEFSVFNLREGRQDENNALLRLIVNKAGTDKVIMEDSLYCMYPRITLKDFNDDCIADIMLFFYNGGRANPTYHLYTVDREHNSIRRVKGFEDLPSPELDTVNNIITSTALAGPDVYYKFYRIDKQSNLVNLGHSFTSGENDSIKYQNLVKQVGSVHN